MENEELKSPGGSLRAYAELLRLPNIFTAVADVVMGFLFVRQYQPGDEWLLGVLIAASTLLYAGGTVLNDVFDYRVDLEQRSERPLPSGRISRKAARWLGIELLVLGAMAAWVASSMRGNLLPGLIGTLLVGCILLYDGWAKRTPLGPLAMGACRMLNVLLGMSVTGFVLREPEWIVACSIGLYVVGVTWFARTESRASSRWQLAVSTAVMLGGIGLLALLPTRFDEIQPLLRAQPQRWYLLTGMLALLIGWRCLRAVFDPHPFFVKTAVRQAIMSIIVLDAAAAFAARGMPAAIALILLLVPTLFAGQWIEST